MSGLSSGGGGGVLAGSVIASAQGIPTGFLECNGSAMSRTVYAALFLAIGTAYGAGNGSTTFNIPDLRGEFIRGFDNGRGADSGRGLGSYQAHSYQSHNHTVPSHQGSAYQAYRNMGGQASAGVVANETTSSRGGSETRPRNIAMIYAIKY